MQLSNQDLSQIDEDELLNLPEGELRHLSIKLLNDLKDARERLSQNSRNSSRPPSSEAPWDKAPLEPSNDQAEEETDNPTETEDSAKPRPPAKKDQQQSEGENEEARKPGKQPGAQGFGRTQKLAITDYQNHYPETCDCCHQTLESRHAIAYAAYETINVDWADVNHPGILVTNTKHTLYEIACTNGHITRKEVNRSSHAQLPDITRTEWRLVGPGLAAMIVCLAYRMRASREHIQEFLYDWLGIKLSVGTINNTLHESGAAAMPLEDEFIQEIINSELLHVDETSWMEHTTFLWLWVFSTDRVTAYWIATRVFAILISVIETYRKRNQSPWIYLAQVIASQRSGLPVPALPNVRASE
jgi:hypothetical protein